MNPSGMKAFIHANIRQGVVKCNDIPFFIGVTVRFIPMKWEVFAKIYACYDSFVICYFCDI